MRLVRRILLPVALTAGALAPSGPGAPVGVQSVPEHRVICRDRTTLRNSWDMGYWVRVEQYLSERDMKELVCAVVAEQKPQNYGRLVITFNFRLDSHDLVSTEEYRRSKLGRYAWSENLGGNPYSLFRRRDERGEPLPRSAQFSSFDHTKECPVEEDSASKGDPKRPQ